MTKGKRVIICTSIALATGVLGGGVGGQIRVAAETQRCDEWAKHSSPIQGLIKPVCQTVITPGAFWQGSTTGLWMGTMLGAFIGGLTTRKASQSC